MSPAGTKYKAVYSIIPIKDAWISHIMQVATKIMLLLAEHNYGLRR